MNSLTVGLNCSQSVCLKPVNMLFFLSNMKVSVGDKTKTNYENGNKEDTPTSPLNRKDTFEIKKHTCSNQQFATLKPHSRAKWLKCNNEL